TGVSWKPGYHGLRAAVEVCVAHSQEGRPRPGTKTDEREATGMAALLAHGVITPSCVAPPAVRAGRDLTRTPGALGQTRTQAKNRASKILADTNLTLASVGSEVLGKSARRLWEALVAGARDAARLSARALGSVHRKIPQRAVALAGQCTAPHATLIAGA